MRANVTFSVPTENIPEEISRLVRNESDDLIQKLHEARVSLSDGNLIDARSKIMSARQALGNADIRLYELDQILAGYIEIVNKTSAKPSLPALIASATMPNVLFDEDSDDADASVISGLCPCAP